LFVETFLSISYEHELNIQLKKIMSDRAILLLTILFVTYAAIANLVRLFWNITITIGTVVLPGWTGAIFFIGFGLMSAWSFRAFITLFSQNPSNPSNP
jgi:hypothetical protein